MELIHVKAKSTPVSNWVDITLNPRHIVKIEMRPDIEMVKVFTADAGVDYISIHDYDQIELGMEHQNDMTITEVVVTREGGA